MAIRTPAFTRDGVGNHPNTKFYFNRTIVRMFHIFGGVPPTTDTDVYWRRDKNAPRFLHQCARSFIVDDGDSLTAFRRVRHGTIISLADTPIIRK